MTPTPEQLAEARKRGYLDGFTGRPLPELHEAYVEAYAEGRRAGTQQSGRVPPPRRGAFDSDFCRAVLARPTPLAPGLADKAGRHEAGVPSHDDEAS